jgi:hypothetical protein
MDPNITHRFTSSKMQVHLHIARLAALALSPRSNGNGNGAARADVITARLEADFDREAVYANALTSQVVKQAKIPMVMPCDRTAIQTVIKTCGAADITRFEVGGPLEEMRFEEGRLTNPWPDVH